MKKLSRISVAAASAVALTVAGLAAAGAASARPAPLFRYDSCAASNYQGYTGTQVNDLHQVIAVNDAGDLTASRHGDQCFIWFADGGPAAAGNDKYAQYAPGGTGVNEYITSGRHGNVTLRRGDQGGDQQWIAAPSGDGYTWTDNADGRMLSTDRHGNVVTIPATSTPPANAIWNFVPAS